MNKLQPLYLRSSLEVYLVVSTIWLIAYGLFVTESIPILEEEPTLDLNKAQEKEDLEELERIKSSNRTKILVVGVILLSTGVLLAAYGIWDAYDLSTNPIHRAITDPKVLQQIARFYAQGFFDRYGEYPEADEDDGNDEFGD
jgi:hypothetical protein